MQWHGDTPYNPRFDDIYRSHGLDGSGGIAQAEHTFFRACNLPDAWQDRPHFTVLEAGFGLGLNFLYTWLAWEDDPKACTHLHFVSIEAYPVQAQDILRSLQAFQQHPKYTRLRTLTQALVTQYWGLTPGLHRLRFAQGQVCLSLCIGDIASVLPTLELQANAVFLDGFSPDRNPQMWQKPVLQAIARLCAHKACLATYSAAKNVCEALSTTGFVYEKTSGLAPKRHSLKAVYAPQLGNPHPYKTPKPIQATPATTRQRHCIVVGAGAAGAACAYALALRGWSVTLLDQARHPAHGASAVPAALFAPKVSADDNSSSRLLRAGQRLLLQYLEANQSNAWPKPMRRGQDWGLSGVRNLHPKPHVLQKYRVLLATQSGYADWSTIIEESGDSYLQHQRAGWVKPQALVQSWLAHPGLRFVGNTHVRDIQALRTECDLLLLANSVGAALLSPHSLPLRPIRGQISFGRVADLKHPLGLTTPVNGNGHIIPTLPDPKGTLWAIGATFERDQHNTLTQSEDNWANIARATHLLPSAYPALKAALENNQTHAWAGVRCYTPDRLPLVGLLPNITEGAAVALCTGLGARGISLAPLCAELLATQIHAEPWPLERKLAERLSPTRFFNKSIWKGLRCHAPQK